MQNHKFLSLTVIIFMMIIPAAAADYTVHVYNSKTGYTYRDEGYFDDIVAVSGGGGVIFAANGAGEVYRFDSTGKTPRLVRQRPSGENQAVRALAAAGSDRLLICTDDRFYIYHEGRPLRVFSMFGPSPAMNVRQCGFTTYGEAWIAAEYTGFFTPDGKAGIKPGALLFFSERDGAVKDAAVHTLQNGALFNSVQCAALAAGRLWVGGKTMAGGQKEPTVQKSGLYYYQLGEPGKSEWLRAARAMPDAMCTSGDTLYLAMGQKIYTYDARNMGLKIRKAPRITNLPDDKINAIAASGDIVWIATELSGVIMYNTSLDIASQFSRNQGLPSARIRCIWASAAGAWAGTDDGLVEIRSTRPPVVPVAPAPVQHVKPAQNQDEELPADTENDVDGQEDAPVGMRP